MSENVKRISMVMIKKMKSLSHRVRAENLTDDEIDAQIRADPDLYILTDLEIAQFKLANERKS